jgi:subtilisin family serine protease
MAGATRVGRTFWSSVLCVALLTFAGGASGANKGVIRTPQPNLQMSGAKAAAHGGTAPSVEIAPLLFRQLASGGHRDFAIEFREHADLSAARSLDWNARGRFVHERLRETAARSQASVQRMLRARGIAFHSYWIKNAILVEHGDIAALQSAAGFAEVARIRELPKSALIKPEHPAVAARATGSSGITPNIAWVGANQVWNDGTTGDGVTVGIIDDGVFFRHEAVVNQYRGNLGSGGFDHDYNWYAPLDAQSEPNGSQGEGHGTHVTGTIVGDNHASDPNQAQRTGMAPGAKWIACLGLPMKGSEFALPACGEFMLAPTRRDGSDPDPDRRPHVVNNSWGNSSLCDGSADDFYRDIVEAWVAAGIFPVFAAGNASNCGLPEPPGLSTVTSPASLASAFAVGSSGNHDGQYAAHSLWGPSLEASEGLPDCPDPHGYPTLKPQVVAPGVDILSAIDGGNGYATMTGTSMSAPHISGLVALMLEAGECLRGDYATLGGIIMQSARPIDYASGGEPPPGIGNLPNYATGWGEIDAPRAVDAAAHACGPQGFIRGTVTSSTGSAIAGAKVEIFVDEAVRVYQATTDSSGNFVRRVPVNTAPGYHVRVSAYGYLPASESGVLVDADTTTRHDVQLATAATYKISGRVTDSATGWALHAKIEISGYPNGPIWTDPTTGSYSVRLPEGTTYRLDVASDIRGYQNASRELASISGGATQNFALAADTVACTAPGYAYAVTSLNEGFEGNGTTPPSGWTRSSFGLGWLFGDSSTLASPIVAIPAHGRFAATNDELGADGGWGNDAHADILQLPPQNLAALSHPVLRYRSFFMDAGHAHVEASTDGGATWNALGTPKVTNAVDGWTEEAVSLASVAAAGARIRFHFDDGTVDSNGAFGAGWAVDDVAIRSACTAPANGGLVVGHVRDANTGAGLNGALVRINAGAPITTTTSIDPGVGDGFFALHAPAGTPTVNAERGSQPLGYGNASLTPGVPAGATVLGELALPAGRLRLHPAGPTASVELGTTTTVPFTVNNSGTLPLNFGFEGAAIEEHFDGPSFPPNGWTVQNIGDGCGWIALDPKRFANTAGGDGGAAMVDLFPCMEGANSNTALISPQLDLGTSHTASMGFFLSLLEGADSSPRLDIDVSTNGGTSWTTVHSRIHDDNGGGSGELVELDLSAFVGSSNVRVRFHYTATPPWGWVMVDQIHLFNSISASAMLDLTPDSGALAAGASRTLDATFDARTVAQPGTYTLPIRVAEDTPYAWPFGDVEATMTVTAPATYGSLGGTVQSLGYCDANPHALADATITIQASGGQSHTTTSAADGSYRYWVEAAQGPFTVTVEAADHLGTTQQYAVAAGVETAADFALRPLQACLLTDPATPAANVAAGQTTQLAFDLLNAGAASADWTLRSGGDPNVLSRVPLVQTTSPTPTQNVSFGCFNPATGYSLENHYLRRFDLAERSVPIQDTTIGGISFAVDSATSSAGSQPITLRVYALNGELTFANMQLLAEKTIDVADTALERIRVAFDQPVHVAGDSVIVAEIYVPSGATGGNAFYPGGNSDGESAMAYWAAHDCGAGEPISYAEAGLGWVNLILEIDTLASDPCGADATAVDWLAVSPSNGQIGADASLPLHAMLNAVSHPDGVYHGSMCMTPGRTSANPVVVPVTMSIGAAGDAIFANGFD